MIIVPSDGVSADGPGQDGLFAPLSFMKRRQRDDEASIGERERGGKKS